MSHSTAASFQQALEMVERLPEEQQQDLVEIVRNRQRERRREALAVSIEHARQEFARGEARRGTIDDLMAEIDEFGGSSGATPFAGLPAAAGSKASNGIEYPSGVWWRCNLNVRYHDTRRP